MSDDTVFIGYGGGLFATVMGGGKNWNASTPQELVNKLDADGVDHARLELIVSVYPSCPDHALSLSDARAFRRILGLSECDR